MSDSNDQSKPVDASLEALKEMEPESLSAEWEKPEPARVKARPGATTEALGLLTGILQETATEASAEQREIEEELRRKEALEEQRRREEEEARRAEMRERLAREEQRRIAAAQRRTAVLEALRMEELRERGVVDEDDEPEGPSEPRDPSQPSVPAVQAVDARPEQTTRDVVAAQERRSRVTLFLTAAMFLVVVGAGAGAYIVMSQPLVDATTSYPKTTPSLVATNAALTQVPFRPIPRREVPAAADSEAEEAEASARTTERRTRRRPTQQAAEPEQPAQPERRELRLGGQIGGRQ